MGIPESGITSTTREGVRTLAFSRPERRNGMDLEMMREYYAALAEAEASPEVRAVVVTGEGGSFCSGATPELLTALTRSGAQEAILDTLGYPPHLPLSLGTPVIAAINGSAAGLGLVHALYADIRIMAEDALLSTVFSRFGLVAEYGAAWLLPRIVGSAAAMDLLLSARKVDAAEALRMGLVHRTAARADVASTAFDYARDLAAHCSPTSMATIKHQVWHGAWASGPDAVAESVALMAESFTGHDFHEAVSAIRERRPPDFAPRSGATDPRTGPVPDLRANPPYPTEKQRTRSDAFGGSPHASDTG